MSCRFHFHAKYNFNHEKILKNFQCFYTLLQESDFFIDAEYFVDFFGYIHFLHKSEILICYQSDQESFNDVLDSICSVHHYKNILISITRVLCSKYIKHFLTNGSISSCQCKKTTVVFDTAAFLLEMLFPDIHEDLVIEILQYFDEYLKNRKLDENLCIHSSESAHNLFSVALKFLSKLLSCFSASGNQNISEMILMVVNNIPLNDVLSVKCLLNYILPAIVKSSNLFLHQKIFKLLWNKIVKYYEDSFIVASDISNNFLLLHYITKKALSDELTVNQRIFEEIIFWEILQSGLISEIAFRRKIAVNIFKALLFGLKNSNECFTVYAKTTSSIMFSTNFCTEETVWNDIIIMFEVLEENQIHIIKPVLPKFSRIIQLTAISNDKERLSSTWSLVLLHRMLKHESRCIVKWALEFIFSLDSEKYMILEEITKEFVKLLIESFNDQALFIRTCEQDDFAMFLSSKKIAAFLKNYTDALKVKNHKIVFLKSFISSVGSLSWSVIPLLHLISALSELDSISAWNYSDIMYVRQIISECQRGQEPTLRAILEKFIFKCCCLFLEWESFDVGRLANLLILFKNTCLFKDTDSWKFFLLKIKGNFSKEPGEKFKSNKMYSYCEENIKRIISFDGIGLESIDTSQIENTSIILTTFCNVSSHSSNLYEEKISMNELILKSLLDPVLTTLFAATKRPYMPVSRFISSLQFICNLMSNGRKSDQNYDLQSFIRQFFLDNPQTVEFLFQFLFSDFEKDNYIIKIKTVFEFLDLMLNEISLVPIFSEKILGLIEKCTNILQNNKLKNLLLIPVWVFTVKLYFHSEKLPIYESISKIIKKLNSDVIFDIIKNNILHDCLLKNVDLNKMEVEYIKMFKENCICQFWNICAKVVYHSLCNDLTVLLYPLTEEIRSAFMKGPKIAVPFAIHCLKNILPQLLLQDINIVNDILTISWKTCLELRGNEAFKHGIYNLIKTIFQKCILDSDCVTIIQEYFDKFRLLSENTFGVFYNVIYEFCSSFSLKNLIDSKVTYIPILVQALTYGPTYHKGQKAVEDTLVYFIEDNISLSINNEFSGTKPSIFIRVIIINYLFKNIQERDICQDDLVFELITGLLDADLDHYDTRTSRFSNSFSHRVRNRIWQVLCLFQPLMNSIDLNRQILLKIFESVETKIHQPSIRYLMEWTVFNTFRNHNALLEIYFSVLQKIHEKRPSFIISVLSILYHLISHQVICSEQSLMLCFSPILVQCMAQNFTVRLYAQTTLIKLFNCCQEKNFTSIINKYEFVFGLIEAHETQMEHGNFSRNIKKLTSDFYFTSFNPTAHFSLETIFFDLPRLCNLPPDEWIRPSLFENGNITLISIKNRDNKMKESLPTQWSSKSVEEKNSDERESVDYNFQKKISPLIDFHMDNDIAESGFSNMRANHSSLILVASLLDKIPNLGGLCRSCEIFGVKEFIVGNLKYVEDKQFQTVAVSSDKWISIKEVKPYSLKEYLTTMKDQGYVLIGAEQTENSVYLENYNFPEKSLVLLGHEKEGIPIDVIQLLDVCVEVPQQGVTRSLNVHVTGAILIWEYTRQHLNTILR